MPRLRVACFSVSLDGFGAGPDQDIDHPLGVGGEALHRWVLETRTFKQMFGEEGGSTDKDDEFARRGFENVGAWILGRNMFGPVRGPWPDANWKGWWGDVPPYHTQVFVLTHHPRAPLEMDGGTTFHFITDGIDAALERARTRLGRANPSRRRRGHDPRISARGRDRRDASCDRAGSAWIGREFVRWARSAEARLSLHRTRADRNAMHVVLTKQD